jgi:hypothetical protein
MGELPPQPDEVTLEELLELARQLEAHPENRPGSDKTWVLNRMRRFQRFMRFVRDHKRIVGYGPDAVQPGRSAYPELPPPA